jgi:hypothetical protein
MTIMTTANIIGIARRIASGASGRGTLVYREFVDLAKANGYQPHRGGYIKSAGGATVAHGWQQFAERVAQGAVPVKDHTELAHERYDALLSTVAPEVAAHSYANTAAAFAAVGYWHRALAWLEKAVRAVDEVRRAEAEGQVRAWRDRHAELGTDASRHAYAILAYRDADHAEALADDAEWRAARDAAYREVFDDTAECAEPERQPRTVHRDEELVIGARVSGLVQGQRFTGVIRSRALRDGELVSVAVATDEPLTTPAGHRVLQALLRGEEEISRLTVLDSVEQPRPCGRTNPHTPHGACLGMAPEYPSEPIEVVGSEHGPNCPAAYGTGDCVHADGCPPARQWEVGRNAHPERPILLHHIDKWGEISLTSNLSPADARDLAARLVAEADAADAEEPADQAARVDRSGDVWVRLDEHATRQRRWFCHLTGPEWSPSHQDQVGGPLSWDSVREYGPLTPATLEQTAAAIAAVVWSYKG